MRIFPLQDDLLLSHRLGGAFCFWGRGSSIAGHRVRLQVQKSCWKARKHHCNGACCLTPAQLQLEATLRTGPCVRVLFPDHRSLALRPEAQPRHGHPIHRPCPSLVLHALQCLHRAKSLLRPRVTPQAPESPAKTRKRPDNDICNQPATLVTVSGAPEVVTKKSYTLYS